MMAEAGVAMTRLYQGAWPNRQAVRRNATAMTASWPSSTPMLKPISAGRKAWSGSPNSAGVALVPVLAGHAYMLDAVVLREPSAVLAEQTGAVWETLWANLTFAVPK